MEPLHLTSDGAAMKLYLDGPTWDGAPTAALGDLTIRDADAGARLLARGLAEARAAGCTRILAPMSGDTWHSYRYVTESDGSPAFLLEPKADPIAQGLLVDAGFAPVSRYFSARVQVSALPLEAPPDAAAFEVRPWDGTEPTALFRKVYHLSRDAFSGNAFYKPIAEDAFLAMYAPMVPMLKRELIFLAWQPDGTLAGFLFALPNYAEGLETKTVILKTYASRVRGAGRHLVHACHSQCRALGHDTVIHALIHDENASADRSARTGAEVFRRYALYGLKDNG